MRQLVPELVRSKTDHRQLAQRLQPKEATQQPELHDAVGVRRKSKPWKRRRPSLLEKRYCRYSLFHRYGCGWLSIICVRATTACHRAPQPDAVARPHRNPPLLRSEAPREHDPKLSAPPRARCLPRAPEHRITLNDFDGDYLLLGLRLRYALAPCIQRKYVQPMCLAKLFTPKAALLKLRNQALCLSPAQPPLLISLL